MITKKQFASFLLLFFTMPAYSFPLQSRNISLQQYGIKVRESFKKQPLKTSTACVAILYGFKCFSGLKTQPAILGTVLILGGAKYLDDLAFENDEQKK